MGSRPEKQDEENNTIKVSGLDVEPVPYTRHVYKKFTY